MFVYWYGTFGCVPVNRTGRPPALRKCRAPRPGLACARLFGYAHIWHIRLAFRGSSPRACYSGARPQAGNLHRSASPAATRSGLPVTRLKAVGVPVRGFPPARPIPLRAVKWKLFDRISITRSFRSATLGSVNTSASGSGIPVKQAFRVDIHCSVFQGSSHIAVTAYRAFPRFVRS